MRRNRRNNVKKERIIMIASSAFVLSALTMTGIYMKSNKTEEQDDGYMLDFTALEEDTQDKIQEIARKEQTENGPTEAIEQQIANPDDDLDYLPMEAGSGLVTIPGLTDGLLEDTPAGEGILPEEEGMRTAGDTPGAGENGLAAEDAGKAVVSGIPDSTTGETDLAARDKAAGESGQSTETTDPGETGTPAESQEGEDAQTAEAENTAGSDVVAETMHFAESDGLLRPVSGEVLIPFSMDSSVYFSTLDQFKYNPAMMIAAEEGSAVTACAEGIVVDIFQDEEIGHAVTMDIGDGYQITYGQLYDINVTLNSHVQPGDTIAAVASPTKYYSVEGSNLYLKLTANGTPVNPEILFR